MVITHMEEAKKMHKNTIYKYGLLISVFAFLFFSFSSLALAVNYGAGLYNADLYSATIPSATASPVANSYNVAQSVTLSTASGNTITYSITATPADCTSGTPYTGPIEVSSTQTLYTLACDTHGNSTPANFTYIIDTSLPGTPTATPSAGTYHSAQSVTLTSTGSVSIRYSTTAIPTNCSSGTPYSNETPILISESQTIYVRSCNSLGSSSTASLVYVIRETTSSGSTPYVISQFQIQQQGGPTIPSATILNIIRTLKQGMTGEDVKALQDYLNAHGYNCGTADGDFGPKTKVAVILFQKANGLDPDGIVGPLTREYMNQSQTPIVTPPAIFRTLKLGMTGDDVRYLQTYLNAHGYNCGTADGDFGLKTKVQVILFQKAKGLTPDGVVGPMTIKMMK